MMTYPIAEKIFERCLGKPLSQIQEIEIREILKAMNDAGWPVEEPTSAALLSIVGFFYARAPNPPIEVALVNDQISETLQEVIRETLGDQFKPIIRLDFLETFKKSFTESITRAISRSILIMTGALMAVTMYGTHQMDIYYFQNQKVVSKSK